MAAQTVAEKILSAKCGRDCSAGDVVVCEADLILGTDGSTPMAIDLFTQMGGRNVENPERVLLSRDHYAPPTSEATCGYHARMEDFSGSQGLELLDVGDGIGFHVALEDGRVRPGDLVVGADSHTVTCGAAGAFSTGFGSTDLAAAFLTGQVWLRVPASIRVTLEGVPRAGVGPKDVALDVVRTLGTEGAAYLALEFAGPLAEEISLEARMVISNLSIETGAKVGIFPAPGWRADVEARYERDVRIDCSVLQPLVAVPHEPANGVPVSELVGTEVDWVLLGTCSGGSVEEFKQAVRVLDLLGGIAQGVTMVATPPSRKIRSRLEEDGTMDHLRELGAIVTETGCGPCCGTSAPIPPADARILSTANRNFRGRMGEPSAAIHLASPVTCAASAARGAITDPRDVV